MAILALTPTALWSALRAKRLLILVVAPSMALTVAWLLFVTLAASSSIWSHSEIPYVPLRVGPSDLSLRQLAWWLAMSLWTPSLAAWLLLSGLKGWRAATPNSYRVIVPRLLAYILVAVVWTTATLTIAEYDHEDTVVAEGFSLSRWEQLKPGMTRQKSTSSSGHLCEGSVNSARFRNAGFPTTAQGTLLQSG